jgi:hypothetical protein
LGGAPVADGDNRDRYPIAFRSDGYQLSIDREQLARTLTELKRDLIVEIEIKRNNNGYESSFSSSEKKEVEYDRVYVLRQNGIIETAEGPVGTWTIHPASTKGD